jgi:hypothetical protein
MSRKSLILSVGLCVICVACGETTDEIGNVDGDSPVSRLGLDTCPSSPGDNPPMGELGSKIRVRATDPEGNPVANLPVWIAETSAEPRHTDLLGRVTLYSTRPAGTLLAGGPDCQVPAAGDGSTPAFPTSDGSSTTIVVSGDGCTVGIVSDEVSTGRIVNLSGIGRVAASVRVQESEEAVETQLESALLDPENACVVRVSGHEAVEQRNFVTYDGPLGAPPITSLVLGHIVPLDDRLLFLTLQLPEHASIDEIAEALMPLRNLDEESLLDLTTVR